jgi:hypothetical protein
MNSSAIPEGPGSVAGAPHLPAGFTGTFTSGYIDTGSCVSTWSPRRRAARRALVGHVLQVR